MVHVLRCLGQIFLCNYDSNGFSYSALLCCGVDCPVTIKNLSTLDLASVGNERLIPPKLRQAFSNCFVISSLVTFT